MIQRKQTVYLFLTFIGILLCLYFPIARFEVEGLGLISGRLFNFAYISPGYSVWDGVGMQTVFFILLLISGLASVINIFLYKKRKLQVILCNLIIFLLFLWNILYGLLIAGVIFKFPGIFHVEFTAAIPLVALILVILAREGIISDEKLVKSLDRIR